VKKSPASTPRLRLLTETALKMIKTLRYGTV